MNFCPNCGNKITSNTNFCTSCGANLGQNTQSGFGLGLGMNNNLAKNILGTLVTVTLVNGLTKKLYQKDGNFFYDAKCSRPYNSAMILSVLGKSPEETATIMGMSGERLDTQTMLKNKMTMGIFNAGSDLNQEFKASRRRARMRHEEMLSEETRHTCLCDYCGEEIDSDSTFCKHCGKKFD